MHAHLRCSSIPKAGCFSRFRFLRLLTSPLLPRALDGPPLILDHHARELLAQAPLPLPLPERLRPLPLPVLRHQPLERRLLHRGCFTFVSITRVVRVHLEGRPICPGASLPVEDQVPQLLKTLPRDDVRGRRFCTTLFLAERALRTMPMIASTSTMTSGRIYWQV